MNAAYSTIAALHGAIGVLALIAFWIAAFARKGSLVHRKVGQGYMIALLGIMATAVPLAVFKFLQAKPVAAAFLLYLCVLTAASMWTAWRAIRDKHDVIRFTGGNYVGLAWLCIGSGLAVLALGAMKLSFLLAGFSSVGIVAGVGMLRTRRNRAVLAANPRWWLSEHYSAMLGNGVATHIAFLSIGLPRWLPDVERSTLTYVAWFGPLAVAVVVKRLIDRRWKARSTPQNLSPPALTLPTAAPGSVHP